MTSETTPVLGLQLTTANQSMKHVTVNEALLRLDALVHLSVKERNRNAPPAAPADGDRYLVGTAPSGAFSGHAGAVASCDAGAWTFLTPQTGWRAYVSAEAGLYVYNGTAWVGFSPTGAIPEIQNMTLLGVGTTADAANPLSVKAGNVLLAAAPAPGGTGDLRVKLNKDAAGNTLSQLYQTGYSGRAETGLIGNDRFAVKVSPDGTAWKVALDVSNATGVITAPQGMLGDKPGFRNRLLNGSFSVNQRAVAGTVTLAAGAYGHDRWKAGPGGCTYTFATSGGETTLTIVSGTLCQVIEGRQMLADGGVYTLSWTGTATARLFQGAASGSFVASPLQSSALTVATDTVVEFSAGTITKAQLEPGTVATAFERLPASIEALLCQRYYYATKSGGTTVPRIGAGLCFNATIAEVLVPLPVAMRAPPTFGQNGSFYLFAANGALLNVTGFSGYASALGPAISTQVTVAGGLASGNVTHLIGNGATAALTFDSEL